MPTLPAGTLWMPPPADSEGNFTELTNSLKGGCWFFPPAEDGKTRYISLGTIAIIEAAPEEAQAEESPGLFGRLLGGGKSTNKPKAPPSADLAKDIDTLTRNIAKLEKAEDPDDFARPWNSNGTTAFGTLLLFATQIHQYGNPDLANRLAESLFKAAPSREMVLDAAINQLADALYKNTTDRFFKSGDWAAYHKDLTALIAKFPRGWEKREAVTMVMESVAKRVAGAPPAVPTLPDIKIEPAAIESIAWMLTAPPSEAEDKSLSPEVRETLKRIPAKYRAGYLESLGRQSTGTGTYGTWLLKDASELEKEQAPGSATIRLGMRALPVLAALIEDDYVLQMPNPSAENGSYSYSSSDSGDRAAELYRSLSRPTTRGDLAALLLGATLPDAGGHDSNNLASLREKALDLYKNHKNASREDLAIVFLQEGSAQQKQEAAQILASSTDPAKITSFETQILANPTSDSIAAVSTYASARKAAAKPFVEKFVKAVQEDPSYEEGGSKQYLDRELRRLQALVTGKSPQAQAIEIAKGDPAEARQNIENLLTNIAGETYNKQFLALLAGASATSDPLVRSWFLASTAGIQSTRPNGEGTENPDAGRAMSAGEIEVWKPLMADDRKVPDKVYGDGNPGIKSIGQLAAATLESSIRQGANLDMQKAGFILGRTPFDIAHERASARIAGKPLPPLPDASKVPAERLGAIVKAAAEKPPADIHPYLKSLTMDERAAWAQRLEDQRGKPLEGNLGQLRSIVTEEDLDFSSRAIPPETVGISGGFECSTASLTALAEKLSASGAGQSRTVIVLTNAFFAPGLRAYVTRHPLLEEKQKEGEEDPNDLTRRWFGTAIRLFREKDSPKEADALIFADLRQESERTTGAVWISGGKASPSPEYQSLIGALPETIAAGKRFSLVITLITRADADKLEPQHDQ